MTRQLEDASPSWHLSGSDGRCGAALRRFMSKMVRFWPPSACRRDSKWYRPRRLTYFNSAGQARKSHRLVRNVRVDGRVRQTLLNLGTHWDVPRELWLRIAQRTEEILAGRQALFPEPETVEQHAQRLARQLRAKGVGFGSVPIQC